MNLEAANADTQPFFRARLEASGDGATVVSGGLNDYDLAQVRECATRQIRAVRLRLAGVDRAHLPPALSECIDAIRARGIRVEVSD